MWKPIITVTLIGLSILGILSLVNWCEGVVHPNADVVLPSMNELAYKEIGRNMIGDTLYEMIKTDGYMIYVSQSQFESINLPQKIGDNLYKMPNGEYVTGLIK